MDLGEFQLPLRQMAQNFFRDGGRDTGRAVVDEFGDFGHGGNLEEAAPMKREISRQSPTGGGAGNEIKVRR
jgi:hypothetical protein